MYCKQITLILFICLIITIFLLLCLWLFKLLYIFITNKTKTYEYFNKRDTKIKIYKNDDILDPDENPNDEEYDPDNAPLKYDIDK